ncbi:hypothetical protein ACQZ6F_27765 [Rhizobium sp. A22-96]
MAMDLPQVTYPSLPQAAASAEGFVPKGWTLEQAAGGDLNDDGVEDIAFVLHDQDPANIVRDPDGADNTKLDTNPRVVGVALGRKDHSGFDLVLANHALIPRRDDPTLDDVFDNGLVIRRGTLQLSLSTFATAVTNITVIFRQQAGRFELIGYDRTEVQRDTGDTTGLSIDYLTHRSERREGKISNDIDRITTSKLAPTVLLSVDDVGSVLDFDPGAN